MHPLRTLRASALAVCATLAACGGGGDAPRGGAASAPAAAPLPAPATTPSGPADAIYTGGPIVTVNDSQPSAEALAVKDGRIVAVGASADVMARKGPATRMIDLGGRTLAPGFVDGHAHFAQFGTQAIGANLLAAPDGGVNTIPDLVKELRRFGATPDTVWTGWIFGTGYDDAIFGRHPTRDDLDKVSTTTPVIAIHISGHLAVLNSAGLRKMGITAASPDPVGGVIRRRAGSREPNGVLEETAAMPVAFAAVAPRTPEGVAHWARRGSELAKSQGSTTVNEGRAYQPQHAMMLANAKAGLYDIDVISYIDYADRAKVLDSTGVPRTYTNHYRVGGMKVTLDGSPQGRTAWRTTPYLLPPEGQKQGYAGYPAIPDSAMLVALFEEAATKKWPTKVHTNGDAAVDQFIYAQRRAFEKHGAQDLRNVLIHGQFIRQDQLDSIKKYDIFPSLFPMHTFYWGDWYMKIVGRTQAMTISPMRSVLARGMRATSHTDAPVALPNLLQVMWATVNRTSRSGRIMGPDERVTPLEALKMITLWGAYQHHEEATKGSLEVGKLADMIVLTDNPLTIEPARINTIRVLETIKEGRTVWTRAAADKVATR